MFKTSGLAAFLAIELYHPLTPHKTSAMMLI
jgi:hypothetical protein